MSLFLDTDQATLQEFLPTDINIEMARILPYIKEVERDIIKPQYVGADLFTELEAAWTDESSGSSSATSPQLELIGKLQNAIANLAMLHGIDRMRTKITDAGVVELNGQNLDALPGAQVLFVKREFSRAGYAALADAMNYLDSNRNSFPTWETSDEFADFRDLIITSAAEFNKWENINRSFLTLIHMRHIMRRVEEFDIKPQLGTELFQEIKDELLNEGSGSGSSQASISSDNEELLEFIKPALAHLTIAAAIDELPITFEGAAVLINVSRMDNFNMDPGVTTVHSKDMLGKKRNTAQHNGQVWMQKLHNYLQENASSSKYSSFYEDEDLYIEDYNSDDEGDRYQNDSTDKIAFL